MFSNLSKYSFHISALSLVFIANSPFLFCGNNHIAALLPLSQFSARQHSNAISLCNSSHPLPDPNQGQFPITAPQQEYSFYLPYLPNLSINQWQGRSNTGKSVKKVHVFNRRSFNGYTKKKVHQQRPAAPLSRRTSQLPHQGLASCHIKDQPAATSRRTRQVCASGKGSLSRYIKNGQPAPKLQGVICR